MTDDNPLADWLPAVGPGWWPLLTELGVYLGALGITADQVGQVKEKFGGLRVYIDDEPQEAGPAIWAAEKLAAHTCEGCGAPGRLDQTDPENKRGWWKTLCTECWAQRRAQLDAGGDT